MAVQQPPAGQYATGRRAYLDVHEPLTGQPLFTPATRGAGVLRGVRVTDPTDRWVAVGIDGGLT
jgi:hypothetical protein